MDVDADEASGVPIDVVVVVDVGVVPADDMEVEEG